MLPSLGPQTFTALLVVPLLLRLVPHRPQRTTALEDAGWLVFSALLMVGLGGVWLATFPLDDSVAITTPDFVEYCQSVATAVNGQQALWSPNRSRLSALPAILAAPHLGTVDALLVNAWVGTGLLGAGLYLWGRSLHSPVAGVASVLMACLLTPLTALGRMLTFYPVIVGTLTLSTGLVALVWRWPGRRTAFAAGVGVALAFLVDLRGLMWALPLAGTAGLRLVTLRRPRIPLLIALGLPIYAAWWLAPLAYPPQTSTLEVLSDLTKGWQGLVAFDAVAPPSTTAEGYVWGRSPAWRIPHTLVWLAEQGARVPDTVRTHPRTLRNLARLVDPFQPLFIGALVASVLGLVRRPGRLLLLAGVGLPFAVALDGAISARFAGLRFLGNGMPVLAVLGGIGFAAVLMGGVPKRTRPGPGLRVRAALGLGFLALVVVGTIDSELSPLAPWRFQLRHADSGIDSMCENPHGVERSAQWVYQLP